jgi:hypothetical protein
VSICDIYLPRLHFSIKILHNTSDMENKKDSKEQRVERYSGTIARVLSRYKISTLI